MEIKEYKVYNEDEILRLYSAVGWTAYADKPEKLRQGFKHSLLVLAAYENDELLGIIRVVGDGFTIVFVQDILVYPEKQRRGVGSTLLKAVLARYMLMLDRLNWLPITQKQLALFIVRWDFVNFQN